MLHLYCLNYNFRNIVFSCRTDRVRGAVHHYTHGRSGTATRTSSRIFSSSDRTALKIRKTKIASALGSEDTVLNLCAKHGSNLFLTPYNSSRPKGAISFRCRVFSPIGLSFDPTRPYPHHLGRSSAIYTKSEQFPSLGLAGHPNLLPKP